MKLSAPCLRRPQFVIPLWLALVLFGASQWFLYDWIHKEPERFAYYLGTSAYFLGMLAPAAVFLSLRWPLQKKSWKLRLVQHLAASAFLTAFSIVSETLILYRLHSDWPFASALKHCFTFHTQFCLLAYWFLLGCAHLYRWQEQVRLRELHTTQLERQLAEAQLSALRSQLQPHFLFNTLQAATTLIYDDPPGAEEVLLSLSELLRSSLQTLTQAEIPLGREMEFLHNYASIQQRRFGDRLGFEFTLQKQALGCSVPSLLLQPLLENAIDHGIAVRKQPDIVSVRAYIEENSLTIEIHNTIGLLDAPLKQLLARGVGLSNTITRLERLYGPNHKFVICNLDGGGVSVKLSLPVRLIVPASAGFEVDAVA